QRREAVRLAGGPAVVLVRLHRVAPRGIDEPGDDVRRHVEPLRDRRAVVGAEIQLLEELIVHDPPHGREVSVAGSFFVRLLSGWFCGFGLSRARMRAGSGPAWTCRPRVSGTSVRGAHQQCKPTPRCPETSGFPLEP